MSSIREQIITAIVSRLSIVRQANGFETDCGEHVFRCRRRIDPDSELDAIVVWPKPEAGERVYGTVKNVMPVQVEGIAAFGGNDPSEVAEQVLADLIEALTGVTWTLPYTGGGTYEVSAGDTVEGADSGATALVQAVSVSTGAWATGDAAGNLTLRRLSGTFEGENLNVGAETNVATTTGTVTSQDAETVAAGGLASDIEYAGGGTEEYPDEGETTVGCPALFNVTYEIAAGNPYEQPA